MKRNLIATLMMLFPIVAFGAPDLSAIESAQTMDELKTAYKDAVENVITENKDKVDSFELISARTQYQENIVALDDAESDDSLDDALNESEDAATLTSNTDAKNQQSEETPAKILSQEDSLAQISELQANADAMRDKEQSTANKILGAAGIGATGIGLMQTASALAQQNASNDATRDMTAYLATFRCDYGSGRNISGGETGITLPGGNQLLPLYTEYITLASDLKTRKEALGLSPGIESEIIQDSATSGLYDNVSLGRGDGVYVSLAAALSDPTGPAAAAWAAQQSATSEQLQTGLITAGVGTLASIIGNIAINENKKSPQNLTDDIIAKYDAKRTVIKEDLSGTEEDSKQDAEDAVPAPEDGKAPSGGHTEYLINAQQACESLSGEWDAVAEICHCAGYQIWDNYALTCLDDDAPYDDVVPQPVNKPIVTLYAESLFDSGKVQVKSPTDKLDDVIDSIKNEIATDTGVEILLVAHTDSDKIIQSANLCARDKICTNQSLSVARAESVRGYIQNKWADMPAGISITIRGVGDQCANPNSSDAQKALERKVDFYVFFNGEDTGNIDVCSVGTN